MLHDILDDRASSSPRSIAVRRGEHEWTYAQLRRLSLRYMTWLDSLGVGRGDRVLVCAPHAPETVAAMFAVSRLGAICVVTGDQLPAPALAYLIGDCEPRVVIGNPAAAETLADVATVQFPAVSNDSHETDPAPADRAPCLTIDPVILIYTSGSTARPKAVVSTHAQMLFAARAVQSQLGYRADDVVFCCLPLSFDYALYQVLLSCLAGATLVLADADQAGPALPGKLIDSGATVLPAVPSLASALTQMLGRSRRPKPALRLLTSTGAHLSPVLAERLRELVPGLRVVSMFGLTECKRVSIMAPDGDREWPGALGRPLPDTELFVVDEHEARLPAGQVGQLVVRGPHVMAGYWRCPELTADRFRRDEFGQPLLFTGDYCRVDDNGYLYFVGRRDDIYKQHGFRVSAVEVEAAALEVPGVGYAALLPPDDERGAVLVVSGRITPEQVLSGLQARLERHKLPADCVVVEALPLAPTGKADKQLLADRLHTQLVTSQMRIVP